MPQHSHEPGDSACTNGLLALLTNPILKKNEAPPRTTIHFLYLIFHFVAWQEGFSLIFLEAILEGESLVFLLEFKRCVCGKCQVDEK